jgi:hypothetical protein
MEIFRFCIKLKKNVKENMNSTIVDGEKDKKDSDKELKILWTTILLVGCTLIGWTPMLLSVAYQIITGNSVDVHWDIVDGVTVIVAVCGDSIILLAYDTRWKASLRDIMSDLQKKFGFMY